MDGLLRADEDADGYTLGGQVATMSVAQFNAFIAKERDAKAKIVKLIGHQPE